MKCDYCKSRINKKSKTMSMKFMIELQPYIPISEMPLDVRDNWHDRLYYVQTSLKEMR